MRVLIFGDSITQGFWDSRGGWAQRLIDDYLSLQIQDLGADVPILFNLGISADTTAELLSRFEPEAKARFCPDEMAFVFAIGTNDSRVDGNQPLRTPEQYASNIGDLITKALRFTSLDKILFVGLQSSDETRTTPVSWRDVSYVNERLRSFDQMLQGICKDQRIAYVPIFSAFQERQNQEDILIDGLHPNDAGHQLIYEQVKPALQKLLG